MINGTAGDDTIVSNLNNVTINAGSRQRHVFAGGTGDTINASNGDNMIQAFAGGNRITTGSGDDTIRIAGSGNTVDAGGGANLIEDSGSANTLVLPAAGQGTDDVYGYVLSGERPVRSARRADECRLEGCVIDSVGLSVAWATGNDGADTTISVAPGGRGAGSVVATLHGNGAAVAGETF